MVALALTAGSLVMPAASHRATVAMPTEYMLFDPLNAPPDPTRLISHSRPRLTVSLYLVPYLCVSPAARNGSRAMPVEAVAGPGPRVGGEPGHGRLRGGLARLVGQADRLLGGRGLDVDGLFPLGVGGGGQVRVEADVLVGQVLVVVLRLLDLGGHQV